MLENTEFVLAKPPRRDGFFVPKIEYEIESFPPCVYIKDSVGAAKQVSKKFRNKKIICEKSCFQNEKTKHLIKEYEKCDEGILLKVFEYSFYSSLEKFGLKAPLLEICIAANPQQAVEIIKCIRHAARLFTVVFPNEYSGKLYDELYFKYGVVIRQVKTFNNKSEGELFIKAEGRNLPFWIKCPVISFEKEDISDKATVALRRVCLNKEKWGIKIASPAFYSLLGIKIDEKTKVDVNNNAEKIFLLDIGGF